MTSLIPIRSQTSTFLQIMPEAPKLHKQTQSMTWYGASKCGEKTIKCNILRVLLNV